MSMDVGGRNGEESRTNAGAPKGTGAFPSGFCIRICRPAHDNNHKSLGPGTGVVAILLVALKSHSLSVQDRNSNIVQYLKIAD